ncbi:MAG TPA: hypothetical protein VNL69_03220 [Bacteroidota bacterium]|nr:hypothetical protein [Bacteroidota bacterium]
MTGERPKLVRVRKHPSIAMKKEWCDLYFHKKISVKSIAETYGYTTWTVYKVLHELNPNRNPYERRKKRKPSGIELPDLKKLALDGESAETMLETIIHALMDALSSTGGVKMDDALRYLNSLTQTLKKLRSIQIEAMLKNIDARVVESIIRHYEPDATDMRVIEVFKEHLEKVKAAS